MTETITPSEAVTGFVEISLRALRGFLLFLLENLLTVTRIIFTLVRGFLILVTKAHNYVKAYDPVVPGCLDLGKRMHLIDTFGDDELHPLKRKT